jgi:predicted RNA binding protein YcfA (HicA-like mRNA interferase family)
MPNYLKNWKYRDVEKFLRKNGFYFNYARGSHHYFVGSINGVLKQVTVPFHGSSAIVPRTMKSIIEQSGIEVSRWLEK